jgi:hypothetical protein
MDKSPRPLQAYCKRIFLRAAPRHALNCGLKPVKDGPKEFLGLSNAPIRMRSRRLRGSILQRCPGGQCGLAFFPIGTFLPEAPVPKPPAMEAPLTAPGRFISSDYAMQLAARKIRELRKRAALNQFKKQDGLDIFRAQ